MTATITSSLQISVVSGTGVTLDAPPVTAISTDDIYNPQNPSQTLTEMLDLVAADAASAQEDAEKALANSGATPSLVTGSPPRPGEAPDLFGQTKAGSIENVSLINPEWVATSTTMGNVVRVQAPTGQTPQTIAPIAPVALDLGRLYTVHWRVQRQTDPTDFSPVACGIFWMAADKSAFSGGTTIIDDNPLFVADGVKEVTAVLGRHHPLADFPAPENAVYFRPFIDLYGSSHVTDIIVLESHAATDSVIGGMLTLPLIDENTMLPVDGRAAIYAVVNPDTSANLRMQVGTDTVPVDIAVNVGSE